MTVSADFMTFDEVRKEGKLITFDDALRMVKRMEPLTVTEMPVDGSEKIKFHVPENWNEFLKDIDLTHLTSVTMDWRGKTYKMTRQSVLNLLSRIGITEKYAYVVPGSLVEPHLDFWMNSGELPGKNPIMLSKDDYVAAFIENGDQYVSNVTVLEEIRDYIKEEFGTDELLVHPIMVNGYTRTSFRIVIPTQGVEVTTTREGEEVTDRWCYGLHMTNSLINSRSHPMQLSGFLFNPDSGAGILPEYAQLAQFSKNLIELEDIPRWVRSTLDQMFAILPVESESLQESTGVTFDSKVGTLTEDIFRTMRISRKIQKEAIENMTVAGDWTAYGILNALTEAVVDTDTPEKVISHVQSVCGSIMHRTEDFCASCGRIHMFH